MPSLLRVGAGDDHGDEGTKKLPQPCGEEAEIVACGGEDGVDGVADRACQVVSLEQSVGLQVPDHRFDRAAPSQLSSDRRRGDAAGVGDEDVQPVAYELVASVSPIDVGAPDTTAGERLDLIDLRGQRVAVPRRAGDRLRPEHELAADGARVGHGNRALRPELVFDPSLALADALHLGSMECVELLLVGRFLTMETADALYRHDEEGVFGGRGARRLAFDVVQQTTDPGPHLAQVSIGAEH